MTVVARDRASAAPSTSFVADLAELVQQDARSGAQPDRAPRLCVVGPSTRFLSGLTYYTYSLCNALGERCEVSALLLRQLIPSCVYPGGARVGAQLSNLALSDNVRRYDGVDWFWFPTLLRGLWFLARRRPDVLVLQWWTGAVLHTYLALAVIARLAGIKVAIEVHELMDTGEANVPGVKGYIGLLAPWLFRLATSFIVHSEYERQALTGRYRTGERRIEVIPHAVYDHYGDAPRWRPAPADCCNILFFGLIRPYKGLEDLVQAFDAIPPEEIDRYWLTIIGETWEGWTLPGILIAESRYRDRITFVNRYVSDGEVAAAFGGADLVVLPYRRSAQSGALHVAMHYGLPVVATAVGGMAEAVRDYRGAVLVDPGDPDALVTAIRRAAVARGHRFAKPRDWGTVASRYLTYFSLLLAPRPAPAWGRVEGPSLPRLLATEGIVLQDDNVA